MPESNGIRISLKLAVGTIVPVLQYLLGCAGYIGNTDLIEAINNHPEVLILKAQQALITAEIQEAKAEAVPEAAITGGYIRNNEEKANAGILAFSIGRVKLC